MVRITFLRAVLRERKTLDTGSCKYRTVVHYLLLGRFRLFLFFIYLFFREFDNILDTLRRVHHSAISFISRQARNTERDKFYRDIRKRAKNVVFVFLCNPSVNKIEETIFCKK